MAGAAFPRPGKRAFGNVHRGQSTHPRRQAHAEVTLSARDLERVGNDSFRHQGKGLSVPFVPRSHFHKPGSGSAKTRSHSLETLDIELFSRMCPSSGSSSVEAFLPLPVGTSGREARLCSNDLRQFGSDHASDLMPDPPRCDLIDL